MEFKAPVDIGNRALQRCGATLMDPTLGFTEDSKNAGEVSFAYGKLRRAELRRNVWRFAVREAALRPIDPNTMLLRPSMWVAATTYFIGSIVSDEAGVAWVSNIPNNLGNQPENSLTWEPYFGPLTVSLYDSGQSYNSGELVYTAAGDGTYRVYVSLVAGNSDVPGTASPWDATVTYFKDQVVTRLGTPYLSLIDLNIGQHPDLMPLPWNSVTTYGLSATVSGSDNIIYSSLGGGNTGFDPSTDGGAHWLPIGLVPWTATFVGGTGSVKWRQIGGAEFPMGVALDPMNIVYPLGAGPPSQSSTLNAYRLPAGYLRAAQQNPKVPGTWLGGPSGITYNDWQFKRDYLLTSENGVIIFHFVADVTDVTGMDDLFCEALAARIAEEVCDAITQSTSQLASITAAYKTVTGEARLINAIETGSDMPPDDDYVTCRL
jgi:hypothetical protein